MALSLLVALALYIVLPSCAGVTTSGENPLVTRYKSHFEANRQEMLQAVQDWNRCGSERPVCRAALNGIEVLTTSFGNLYWESGINGKQEAVPVPTCLAQTDAEVIQAVALFRQGTAAGFRAYDDGLSQMLPSAVASIKGGTDHLEAAEARIRVAQCD
jgi:hypothetical protein